MIKRDRNKGITNSVHHAQAEVSSTGFECGPVELCEHRLGAVGVAVLTTHEAGTASLHHFNLVRKGRLTCRGLSLIAWRVPHAAGKFQLWADEGLVGPLAHISVRNTYVPPDHFKGTTRFCCDRADVLVPFQVGLDGDSEVFNAAVRRPLEWDVVQVVVV